MHFHVNIYKWISLYKNSLIAVLSNEKVFERVEEVSIQFFNGKSFIIMTEYAFNHDVSYPLEKERVQPDIRFTSTNDFSIISMVESDMGYTILLSLVPKNYSGNYICRNLKQSHDIEIVLNNLKEI